MSTGPKRERLTSPDSRPESIEPCTEPSKDDPVIGLDVCGKIFYCHRSTLVSASPYFATRFNGHFDAAVISVDPQGRAIYFVERPSTFFQYIFEYIVSGNNLNFPDFQQDPALIRNLRVEADYFGLEQLSDRLKVTKSFCPHVENKGLLYWLGTKKGTGSYENPFTIAAVDVRGSISRAPWPKKKRESFVHFQEPVEAGYCEPEEQGVRRRTYAVRSEAAGLLGSCRSDPEEDIILDLKSVKFRPSHYSMRAAAHPFCRGTLTQPYCAGMRGEWSLSASNELSALLWDGIEPTTGTGDELHFGRGENEAIVNLVFDPKGDNYDYDDPMKKNRLAEKMRTFMFSEWSKEEISETITDFLECECRETWKLEPAPSQCYRFFRLRKEDWGCVNGEGIELFGDVYED